METAGGPWASVELRDLRVFLAVAEELHFGRAAERLGVNPSRVSQVIRALESKVGGPLFERTSRRVRLTAAGNRLQDNLVQPLKHLEHGFADARAVALGHTGTLRIGMYSRLSCGPYWLEIHQRFRTLYPLCTVEMVALNVDQDHLAVLRSGDLDMLATRLPISDDDITVGPLLSREPRVVLVAHDDPLADCETVTMEEVADRSVSYMANAPREMIDAFVPPSTVSGRKLRRSAAHGFEDALLRVVSGQSVHLTVPSVLDYYTRDGVVAVSVRDLPHSETALAWLSISETPKITSLAQVAVDVTDRHGGFRTEGDRHEPA